MSNRGNEDATAQSYQPRWMTGEAGRMTAQQCCITDGPAKSLGDLLLLPLRQKWSPSHGGRSTGRQSNPCMKPIWLSSPLAKRASIHQRITENPPLQRLTPPMSLGGEEWEKFCFLSVALIKTNWKKSIKESHSTWCGLTARKPEPNDLCRLEGPSLHGR